MTVAHQPPDAAPGSSREASDTGRGLSPLQKWLLIAGIVPALLGVIFLIKVITMGHHDRAGLDAWDERDAAAAMEHYSSNREFNLLQPWIAHFDAGDAAFLLGENARAVAYFQQALDRVPQRHECTVRINLALTQEAIGDSLANELEAAEAYRDALKVLKDGDCPTHAGQGKEQSEQGRSVHDRLEEKLSPEPPPRTQKQPPPEEPKDSDEKEKKLDQRNGDGETFRRDDADLDDYGGFSDEPQW